MAFTPLTQEQFQSAQKAGFSTDQIIANEKIRQQNETPQQSVSQKVGAVAKTVGNVATKVGNALTSSEQTLGKGLSTVGSNIPQQQTDQTAQNAQNVGKLLAIYHVSKDPVQKQHLSDVLKSMGTDVTAGDINGGFDLSNKQVIGSALGTALDIASAGSYGKAARGAETGTLLTKEAKATALAADAEKAAKTASVVKNIETVNKARQVVPVTETLAKEGLGSTLKSIGTKTATRAAVGATAGYGYDVSQNLQSGKTGGDAFKPGAGTVAGGAIPIGIGAIQAAGAITKDMAPRIINSLVKPRQADFAYGKNPGRTVAAMGITGNNLQDFGTNVQKAKEDVGRQIGAIYSSPQNTAKTVNAESDIQKLDQAIADAAKGGKNNQGIVTTLANVKDSLLHDHQVSADGTITKTSDVPKDLSKLSLKEAFDLKQKVAAATQFTGRPSDDKTINSALKSVYGRLKDRLNSAVSTTNPEITSLNQKYADLTSADLAIAHRDQIVQRSNLISLPGAIEGGGAALSAAIISGGAAIPTILAGASAVALEKALSSTASKTRIAAWLGSESPGVIQKVLTKNPGIKTVLYRALPKLASKLGQ